MSLSFWIEVISSGGSSGLRASGWIGQASCRVHLSNQCASLVGSVKSNASLSFDVGDRVPHDPS